MTDLNKPFDLTKFNEVFSSSDNLVKVYKNKKCDEVVVLGFPALDPELKNTFSCGCAEVTLTKSEKGVSPPTVFEPRYLDYNCYSVLAGCKKLQYGFFPCSCGAEVIKCMPECAPCCATCAPCANICSEECCLSLNNRCCKKKEKTPCCHCGPCKMSGLTSCFCDCIKNPCDFGLGKLKCNPCAIGCIWDCFTCKACCQNKCEATCNLCKRGQLRPACCMCASVAFSCSACKGWTCCEAITELQDPDMVEYMLHSEIPDYKGLVGSEILVATTISNGQYAVVQADVDVVDASAIKMGFGVVLYAGPPSLIASAYEVKPDVAKFFEKERYSPPNACESTVYKCADLCVPWMLRAPYGLRKESILAKALRRSGVGFDVIMHAVHTIRVEVDNNEVAAMVQNVMQR
jgi:hypothetical protein